MVSPLKRAGSLTAREDKSVSPHGKGQAHMLSIIKDHVP